MGRKRASGLTPRQREWLRHLRKAERVGTVRAYAQRHGLSEHAMYQAAKDLRRKGVLAPTGRTATKGVARRSVGARGPRFVEVKASRPTPPEMPSAWRARLPNGVVVEGSGDLGAALEALQRL
jgi:hypothetical protein